MEIFHLAMATIGIFLVWVFSITLVINVVFMVGYLFWEIRKGMRKEGQ